MKRLLPLLAFIAATGCMAAATDYHEMRFFVREGMSDELLKVEGHPCGLVTPVRLTEIPAFPEDGPIEASEVVEFNQNDEIIATWRLPADYVVEGLSGDRLLVDIHRRKYWVGRDGSILPASVTPIQTGELRACPALILEHFSDEEENAYLYCTTMQDGGTQAQRNLAYEGVCT